MLTIVSKKGWREHVKSEKLRNKLVKVLISRTVSDVHTVFLQEKIEDNNRLHIPGTVCRG